MEGYHHTLSATYFYQNGNPGACGTVHSDSDFVVALDTYSYQNGANCGRKVKLVNKTNGKSTIATVADECPTCNSDYSVDCSLGTFLAMSELAVGIFDRSSVCRAALSRGWNVSSISSSGNPFRTPKGHLPAWVSEVSWHKASALQPETYRAILRDRTAIVHTVGLLFETIQYKEALRHGDLVALSRILFSGSHNNPLRKGREGSYETVNRDTALMVCETFLEEVANDQSHIPRAFIYLSAEDMGRPFVPRRYIETKREAEARIHQLCEGTTVRDVFIRPSFIYHPHIRPLSSPIAALASLSATLHKNAPSIIPTPSRILRSLSPKSSSPRPEEIPHALQGLSQTLELEPIHLDHVGEAICKAIEGRDIHGAVPIDMVRKLACSP
ncbi:hypothetical protein Clacol_006351 [Clathrus columnatus]|uniref:Uncharacterized protein n=1 Tax=Clathrus columnatus TaxID=1419009 RepID=A0AAV5AGT8_9AGAM|nr:hypothetical protein Clacol_006351 [Clathrus columnatus]